MTDVPVRGPGLKDRIGIAVIELLVLAAAWYFLKLDPPLVAALAAVFILSAVLPGRLGIIASGLGMLGVAALVESTTTSDPSRSFWPSSVYCPLPGCSGAAGKPRSRAMQSIRVIDSHTEGEPTRLVISGGPDLGPGPIAARARLFRERFDHFRSAIVNEPRGHDAVVGGLLLPPANPRAACGVIFFNNVGTLHSCGHGTIGLAATLSHLNRITPGTHIVETPVGDVTIHLADSGDISIDNVASYRHAANIPVEFDFEASRRSVRGDIAWGGNWFFLVNSHEMSLDATNIERLTAFSWAIRHGLARAGITGKDAEEIDHVELFGPPARTDCDSRSFVLCPGKAYDRSPCGTGTSAKMACLYADGKLEPGREWRQESIIGSRFVGRIRIENGQVIPTISGRAFITAESTLIIDERDPFKHGIRL